MFSSTLLYGGLIPAAVAVVATFLAARLRTPPPAQWATGASAGVIFGLLALRSRAGLDVALRSVLHPTEVADWVPLIVFTSWLAAMLRIASRTIRSQPSTSPPVHCAIRAAINIASLLFTIAVPLRLLSGNVRLTQEWSLLNTLACLTILTFVLTAIWRLLATPDDQRQTTAKLPLLVATTIVAAIVLSFAAHVLVYGEACATLAAALFGTALARLLPLSLGEDRGEGRSASASRTFWINGLSDAAAPITFTFGSYLILGHFFADLSTLSATLLALSLIAAGGPMPTPLSMLPRWQQSAIRVTACLLPLIFLIVRVDT